MTQFARAALLGLLLVSASVVAANPLVGGTWDIVVFSIDEWASEDPDGKGPYPSRYLEHFPGPFWDEDLEFVYATFTFRPDGVLEELWYDEDDQENLDLWAWTYVVPDPEDPDFIQVERPFEFPLIFADPYYILEYDFGVDGIEYEYLVYNGYFAGYAMFSSYIFLADGTLIERSVLALYPVDPEGDKGDV